MTFLPYLVLLVIMTVLVIPKIRNKNSFFFRQRAMNNVLCILAYIIYIVFVLTKKIDLGIGATDAYYYRDYFLSINTTLHDYLTNITTFEPGYSIISWFIRQYTSNYLVMLFVWHTLTFILLINFMEVAYAHKTNFFVILLILSLLLTQLNTLRMSISISLSLYSMTQMNKKHWWVALLIIIAAISIQVSAVIMVPVWLISYIFSKKESISKALLTFFIILGIICAAGSVRIIEWLVADTEKAVYLGQSSLSIGTYMAVIIILFLSYWKCREMIKINAFNRILMLALPVCLICIPLQYNISIMYRLTLYFIPIMLALIPSLQRCYCKRNIDFLITNVCLCSYIFIRIYKFCVEDCFYICQYISTFL